MCTAPGCPRRSAVHEILAAGGPFHVVELRERSFRMVHPLIERLPPPGSDAAPDGAALFDCALEAWIASQGGPPRVPGTWRVHATSGGEWVWVPLPRRDTPAPEGTSPATRGSVSPAEPLSPLPPAGATGSAPPASDTAAQRPVSPDQPGWVPPPPRGRHIRPNIRPHDV
jgi:Family of unknown function (DUF6085)